MSTLSDVQTLYGSVQGTWAKSQADVIAHVVLAAVVFWIWDATMPEISVPTVDPKQIAGNEWFKLAKETGVIYVLFIIPFVLLAVYGALLRTGGHLFVAALMLVVASSTRQRNEQRLLSASTLEPLALTIDKKDFDLDDLRSKANVLALKYAAQKNSQWESFQESMNKLPKNSQVYLGDFLLFLLFWIVLFRFFPDNAWVQANDTRYWPVAISLAVLAWFAWFRVSRAIAVLPSLFLMYTALMIHADPDLRSDLDASEEKRESVRERLTELLRKERQKADFGPSLFNFIRHRTGLRTSNSENDTFERRGWPFHSFYENGFRFSYDSARSSLDDDRWLTQYAAYMYYRLHRRLSALGRAAWQLGRYIVTGSP